MTRGDDRGSPAAITPRLAALVGHLAPQLGTEIRTSRRTRSEGGDSFAGIGLLTALGGPRAGPVSG